MSGHIVVTGAAGFIGSHLCEALLSGGHQVIGIDNFDSFYERSYKWHNLEQLLKADSFQFLEGDAGDVSLLESIQQPVGAVIHLAARAGVQPSLKDPQGYVQANISVTNTLLEWMRRTGIKKLVFASSSSVYGNTLETPFQEDQNTDAAYSPYAFTKKACEVMNYTYHALYGIDVVNLRFFTVYGERQRPDLAIHKFVRLVYEGKPIRMYGDGSTARDYTYYADTIQGIIGALKYVISHSGIYEIINLGNSSPVQLKDLIAAIAKATGIEPHIIQEAEKPGDVTITYADISRAQQLLNYHPQTDLETGISRFVSWYQKYHLLSRAI